MCFGSYGESSGILWCRVMVGIAAYWLLLCAIVGLPVIFKYAQRALNLRLEPLENVITTIKD